MAYTALYRKWRPLTFDDVVGQEHITNTLKNEIITGRIGHAYLFCGSRGTGKTSTARILSRAINCLDPQNGNPCNKCAHCLGILDGTMPDITEIDAASNNGVDNIRNLREEARFSGSALSDRVYIVDEVHMLSGAAFNALLKTLEEPPAHVHFILATTESHKIPQTILSRCQRFDFRRINVSDIEEQIKKILKDGDTAIEDSAIRLIAEKADGAMRDALSILDQCISVGGNRLTYAQISDFLGTSENEYTEKLIGSIAKNDVKSAFAAISDAVTSGKNIPSFTDNLIMQLRNILLCKYTENPSAALGVSEDEAQKLLELAALFTPERLVNVIKLASEAQMLFRTSLNTRLTLEIAVIKMTNPVYDLSSEALAERLSALESKIASGVFTAAPASAKESKSSKKEVPKLAAKPADSANVAKIKHSLADITAELISGNNLQVSMAISAAEIEENDGKLAFVFNSDEEFSSLSGIITDNKALLTSLIERFAGFRPDIIVKRASEEKRAEQDNLIKLYNDNKE